MPNRTVEFIIAAAVQPEIKNHASDFLLRRLLKEARKELGNGLPAARISNLVELDIKSLRVGQEFAPVILIAVLQPERHRRGRS